MNFLTRFSLKNTIAIIILTILVVVSGLIATQTIKKETFPDVTFPALMIKTIDPGASSEEMEEKVTIPLEEALSNLKDYDSISSISSDNLSFITIMFSFGSDMSEAKAEAESVINKLSLAEGIEPTVETFAINATPVYQVALSSKDLSSLQNNLEQNIVPRLEKVDGVSSITLTGKQDNFINITVEEAKAKKYGLTLSQIKNIITQKQYKVPVGFIKSEGNTIPLQMKGTIENINEIKELMIPIALYGPGQQSKADSVNTVPNSIKLADIAEVSITSDRTEISRFNGEDSIMLDIVKAPGTNTADVVNQVKEILDEETLNSDYKVYPVLDLGAEVEKSISSLLQEGGFGALFTVIVILFFLRNIRATIIAIISLPISILGTIALLSYFDYTLNIMTLGGMAVAVGRIVDDSIVVIENIYRWKQLHPEMKQKELVFKATKEVMGAIASSTLATLIVFLPLALVSGMIGEFFRPFSLAVVFSITISLFVSIMLIPVLGNTFFKKVKHHEAKGKWIAIYEKLLHSALNKKILVISLAILLLAGSFAMSTLLGKSFLPSGGNRTLQAEITLPERVSLSETDMFARKVEEYLKGKDEVNYSQVSIGFGAGRSMPGVLAANNVNVAKFTIELKENVTINDVMKTFETEMLQIAQASFPEATIDVEEMQKEGPPTGNNIELQLFSDSLDSLRIAAKQIEDLFNQNENLKNVSNDMQDTQTKLTFTLNEEGQKLQVNPFQIVQMVNERVTAIDGGTLMLSNEEWNVSLEYKNLLTTKNQIKEILVPTTQGLKPLSEIITIKESEVPSSIKHKDGRTAATVSAVIIDKDTAAITEEVLAEVNTLSLPSDVTFNTEGGLAMIQEGFRDLGLAMGAAIILVFLVLTVTFGGVITPLVVLSSLIFVPIGALGGLLIVGETLSMSALIGMLMLIGIVVTNAVVLLDRVEKNRLDGMELKEAIMEASVTRFRPILMTALATIFALVPLALSTSTSGLISKGLAVTVIGGLTTSTLLTLIFIPVVYMAVGHKRKIEKEDW